MLPIPNIRDFLPDPRRPALADIRERLLYLKSAIASTHTTLAVSNTKEAAQVKELQRIRSVLVGTVAGGTVTIQVQVDGRDMFLDAERPVSGSRAMAPSNRYYNFPANSVVKTIIEATSGAPTGNANIVIDTEPFVLVPRTPEIKLKGRSRLFVDQRRAVRVYNAAGSNTVGAVAQRTAGGIGSGSRIAPPTGGGGVGEPAGNGGVIIDPPIKPGPIKPPKPGGGGGGTIILPPHK